jgi:acyl-CoA dehydrogenase
MDFSLSEEQKAVADLTRDILSDQCTLERLKAIEETTERIDRETWAKLAEAGLLATAIPEAHGGAGFGLVELCLLLEQVGAHVAHVPALATLALGALPMAEFGTPEQKERFLPAVARGEILLSAALVEIGADPRHPLTRAEPTRDGFRVTGVKSTVPIASHAERVLVPARSIEGGVVVLLVDPRSPGVSLERQETMSWEALHRMSLEGVTVDRNAILGSAERGEDVLAWMLDRATVALCAIATGVAQAALRITAEYAASRKQFEKPIASFQAVSQRLADAYIDNEAISLTMWQAATRLGEGMPSDKEIATAKFWACEGGSRIGHTALHVHGGISIDVDYPIQRYFLWAKQIAYTLGAATPQLLRLGDLIAAEPA